MVVNVTITCKKRFYGPKCDCQNGTNYYCNQLGKKVCLDGMCKLFNISFKILFILSLYLISHCFLSFV